MSQSTAKTWTCDRCGVQETTEVNEQPRTWVGVQDVQPPLMAFTEARTQRKHLCSACYSAFVDFLCEVMAGGTS